MSSDGSVRDFAEETIRYSSLADEVMSKSDTLILNGRNCGLKVSNSALYVRTGSLLGESNEPVIYYRGTIPFRKIIILSHSGNISIDALYWCRDQGISLVLLDRMGNLVHSITPERKDDAKLRRLQYQAGDTGMGGFIARELARLKTTAQIEVLKTLPERERVGETIAELIGKRMVLKDSGTGKLLVSSTCKLLEDGLADLPRMKRIESIRSLEGRLANYYWDAFIGQPLKWRAKDAKIVPPHWQVITDRMSSLSGGVTARRAINPFHTALNYLYGVAEHQLLCSIYASGLDPYCGFLHDDKEGRPSLVFDLIEPHRAGIDSAVFAFFNRTELRRGDITQFPSGQIAFNSEFCRYLIASCLPDRGRFDETVSWLKGCLTGSKE